MEQNCLRLKVRDAIEEFLCETEKAHITGDIVDLTCDIADKVFEALGISEVEQDNFCNVTPSK